jgi:hypothetical protein
MESRDVTESPVTPQTSTLAIVSVIAGVLSWFVFPIIGAIVAVVTGHMAKNEIRQQPGSLSGDGLATAGLILGYLHLVLVALGFCLVGLMLVLGLSLPLICWPFANQFNTWLSPLLGF